MRKSMEKLLSNSLVKITHYCTKQCQTEDWQKVHKFECKYVKNTTSFFVRLTLRTSIVIKNCELEPAFNGRTWADMRSLHQPHADIHFSGLITECLTTLAEYRIKNGISRDALIEIFYKVSENHLGILYDDGRPIGFGVYVGYSVHKHSCKPSAYFTFRGKKAQLRPLDPVDTAYNKAFTECQGEILLLSGIQERKKLLWSASMLDCKCDRCMNGEWEEWGRSLVCTHCSDGCCPVYQDGRPVVCAKCHGRRNYVNVDASKLIGILDIWHLVLLPGDEIAAIIGMFNCLSEICSTKSFIMIRLMYELLHFFDFVNDEDAARDISMKLCSSLRHYCSPRYPHFVMHIFNTAIRFASSAKVPNEKELKLMEAYLNPSGVKPLNFTDAEFAKATDGSIGQIKKHRKRAHRCVEILIHQARYLMTDAFGEDHSELKKLDQAKITW